MVRIQGFSGASVSCGRVINVQITVMEGVLRVLAVLEYREGKSVNGTAGGLIEPGKSLAVSLGCQADVAVQRIWTFILLFIYLRHANGRH